MGDKFEVELANGNKKEATLITRVKPEGKDIEYIYYFIEDEEDSNNVAIYASKVVKEDNKNVIKDLENEDRSEERR